MSLESWKPYFLSISGVQYATSHQLKLSRCLVCTGLRAGVGVQAKLEAKSKAELQAVVDAERAAAVKSAAEFIEMTKQREEEAFTQRETTNRCAPTSSGRLSVCQLLEGR